MTIHAFGSNTDPATLYSDGGDFTNPFTIISNGSTGNTQTFLMYLNNFETTPGTPPSFAYDAVTIKATPDSKVGPASLVGWQMKVLSGVNGVPSEADWDAVAAANTITYYDASRTPNDRFPADATYYFPLYVRIYIPAGTPVQQVRVVKLEITGTQV